MTGNRKENEKGRNAGQYFIRRGEEFELARRRLKTWQKVVCVLACFVVFITTYMLILPAITMESSGPYCGETAHRHVSSCYDENGELICGLSEHTHTLECYSDSGADLEDESDWEASVSGVELTGNYALDLLQIAQTQLGYEESTKNYIVEYEDTSSDGYGSAVAEDADTGNGDTASVSSGAASGTESAGTAPDADTASQTDTSGDAVTADDNSSGTVSDDASQAEDSAEVSGDTSQADAVTADTAESEEAVSGTEEADTEDNNIEETDTEESVTADTDEAENSVPEDDLSGTKKGYTRYGAWYGVPYGDWCAMYISFCLNYAEIPEEDFPRDASCVSWVASLTELGLYHSASDDYTAQPGDLIFFDFNGDGAADHVGIIAGYSDSDSALSESEAEELLSETIENLTAALESGGGSETETGSRLVTIEGNSSNKVRMSSYDIESSAILGYGEMAVNDDADENAADVDEDAAAESSGESSKEVSASLSAALYENALMLSRARFAAQSETDTVEIASVSGGYCGD